MRSGGPARILLAILAGAVCGPLFAGLELVTQVLVEGRLSESSEPLVGMAGLLALSIAFGGPIALAAILILFGPMWMLHHQRALGPYSFILLATLAGSLMGVLITSLTGGFDPLMVLLFAIATAPTGAIMWWVGYGFRGNHPKDDRQG